MTYIIIILNTLYLFIYLFIYSYNKFLFKDDYLDALNRIVDTVVIASKFNIKLSYEVFIHKVDGLSDDLKIGKTFKYINCYYY